ncbi:MULTISPECIES: YifB family Mg chelatase-like AAA ATPase [unclassified Pseudoalteromonas]|uniref:YifB family Mg chelatase-like AAA ATPase n=1 Tax=unclassified Pseudoalteromonas TaxID=194690 RepID=UPI0025B2BAFD|nr:MULTISPECIES: YifB family Mg chelatase-like AAA ATPase [unclassified Pseudoalteromonas]MDN3378549.1 YifB family Mg chelatase-like AAA ATPase [Pseudoalteromonas sp. APC 3893]MDN3387038.1 YifB family Mg chelatase-like AAA ATPase [Pseudoalteromonas sp. APC 4017]
MSLARIYSRAQIGIQAPEVMVEVHLGNGLPAFHIVGLPEASVKEAKDRVRSALENSQFGFPDQRITVNLAPADLPKDGGRFDLAIAVGILVASGQVVCNELERYEFYGELALNGEVRGVNAILPSVLAAKEQGRCCFLPAVNDSLASLVNGVARKAVYSIQDVWNDLLNQQPLPLNIEYAERVHNTHFIHDLSDVKGQPGAKRVLEIAAAGGHNLLFLGPPGTGKSMLAQRMPTIMPGMSDEEALSSAALYSIIGQSIDLTNWRKRPFRSPHHTCSAVALVGGSSNPKPGEISLAHNGVLFLDELPEFERKVLDSLREPMETGTVTISRAARQMEFPAQFQLIAALNPSPTGCHNDKRATSDQVMRYLSRVSGPFIDRIDLQIELPRLSSSQLQSTEEEESSEIVRARVEAAYNIQLARQGKVNARLNNKEMSVHCALASAELHFLAKASEKLSLSPRSYHRVIKVARTISDLKGATNISLNDLKEALNYRAFERLISQLTQY